MKKFLVAILFLCLVAALAVDRTAAVRETANLFTAIGNQFTQGLELGPQPFSALSGLTGQANVIICTDCQVADPCVGGGTGAEAKYFNGQWNCLTGSGSSGALTGSGTTGTLPLWTGSAALGDSGLSESAGQLTSTHNIISDTASTATNGVLQTRNTPTSCPGSSTLPNGTPLSCQGTLFRVNIPAATGGTVAAVWGQTQTPATSLTGTPVYGGVFGQQSTFTGTAATVFGTAGYAAINGGSGSLTNASGLIGIGGYSGGTQTATNFLSGVFGVITTSNGSGGSQPNAAAFYAPAPLFPNGSTKFTHLYGMYIEDQTGGGTQNPDPWGLFVAGSSKNQLTGNTAIGAHLNQVASGNFAGTCTMAAATSCTITLSAAYSGTPGCIATVQGATAIAGACGVSSTTVTITAASSNSATWAAMLFGNPN